MPLRSSKNSLERIPQTIEQYKEKNAVLAKDIPLLKEIVGKQWKKEDELKGLKSELAALDRKIQLELAKDKEPFSLDSKEPNWANFHDFLLGEVRYLSVKKAYPNEAEELFAEAQKMAQLRYKTYVRKQAEDWSQE